MKDTITLNLKGSPLVLASQSICADAEVVVDWPKKLNFIDFRVTPKSRKEVDEKLDWIKRQYQALSTNRKTRAYAPHVAPLASKLDMSVMASKTALLSSLGSVDVYGLEYVKNLRKTLGSASKQTNSTDWDKSQAVKGSLINDRARFRVISATPRNELEAGYKAFYSRSGLSYSAALEQWLELDFDTKLSMFKSTFNSGIDLQYQLEVVLEPQLLIDSTKAGMFSVIAMQPPTPSHGYSLPTNLADGGMMERCFDLSYELHSHLLKIENNLAPLACLWGHRQRALVSINHYNLSQLVRVKKKRLSKLAKVLQEKIAEVHPLSIEEVRATER